MDYGLKVLTVVFVSDDPELYAQVPASLSRGLRQSQDGGRDAIRELPDVYLPRDKVHGSHSLSEP